MQRPGDEPLPEPSQAGAADQAAAGSEGQSDRDAQQPGASSDVADMEAHLTLQEDGQPGSGRAPVGARRAATSASAGQPAAAEVPEEPTSAAECPAAAEGLQKLMPAAGQPEWQPEHQPEPARKRQQRAAKPKQQAEPARKRQRRAVKPGRRAAGAAAEPVEVAAAVRQLAVLASPGEHGSARDLPALGAIEQEGNDVSKQHGSRGSCCTLCRRAPPAWGMCSPRKGASGFCEVALSQHPRCLEGAGLGQPSHADLKTGNSAQLLQEC